MHTVRNLTPRGRAALIVSIAGLMGLLLAFLFSTAGGEKSPPPGAQNEQRQAAAPSDNTTDDDESAADTKNEDNTPKWTEEELANGMRLFNAGEYHPWVTLAHPDGHAGFRYSGPQTPEALAAVFYKDSEWQVERRAELLAHWQRVLDRGAVVQDSRDVSIYGVILMTKLSRRREKLVEMSSKWGTGVEELENRLIDAYIRSWPVEKAQMFHASRTGEGTLNVRLDPESRTIYTIRIGAGSRPPLTAEEEYNISRHGVAPKGYRLRFIGKSIADELPPEQVPFFSERKYVEELSDAKLTDLLVAIPTYLSQPEALDQSDIMWMSMVDRYDAALEELASRGQVPQPFAGRESPPSPSGAVRSPPDAAPSPGPPVEQRESTAPPIETRDKEALAEAERRRRIAEAFLDALEKAAEEGDIDSAARALISARLRELRLLRNPDLLKPPAPPSSPPPSQENESEDDES